MRRRVIVIVAAVVPVVALAIAIAVGGSGSSSSSTPAKLPIAFGTGGPPGAAANAALDAATPAIYPYAPTRYVAANDLPDLGGEARAYKVVSDVTDPRVTELARALGVDAVDISEASQGTTVNDSRPKLTVLRSTGQWAVSGPIEAIASSAACANADGTPCTVPVTTLPPNELSEDDARAKALAVLRPSGMDTDHAAIVATLQQPMWQVMVDPIVDGTPTSGYGATVWILPDGTVANATGFMAHAEPADTYPRLTTHQVIDQMTAGLPVPMIATASDVAVGGACAPATEQSDGSVIAPCAPIPVPDGAPTTALPPHDVTITAATPALLYQPTYDGQSGYLVPAYRFSTDDGQTPIAPAIDRSWFAPPPVDSTPPSSAEPGSVGGEIPPAQPAEPPVTAKP